MKKVLSAFILLFAAAAAFGGAKKIDASSNEKLQETFFEALTAIENDGQQQAFASAMATIGVVLSQKYGETAAHKKYVELVNGKTADEIVALAKSMTPQLRGTAKRVDGRSAESFNASVGRMLIGVSLDKQRRFSAAVAKIMYDAEQKKLTETDVAKMLDGKTVEEVIDFAAPIKTPFPTNESEEFYLTPVSKEELRARKIIPAEDEAPQPYSKSLVPTSAK